MFWLAAISLGFLGSFHCIGMCGPIALSIPVKRTSSMNIFAGSFVYNTGRIITYAVLGFIFGLLGSGFVLAGWQNGLSIALGIFILTLLLSSKIAVFRLNTGFMFHFLEKLKAQLRKLFGRHTIGGLLMIGLLNGLLPCGLVYLGIAGAVATGSPVNGALFMSLFGLGTFPAMMLVSIAKDRINIRFREKIRKSVPVFVGIMAVLLILRGLNLGIPYISPELETNSGILHHKCCHK